MTLYISRSITKAKLRTFEKLGGEREAAAEAQRR